MVNAAILKQDFLINRKTIGIFYLIQFCSLLIGVGIRNMRLIQIADIFWDTLPVVIIPMAMSMVLGYTAIKQRSDDKTMDFLLAAPVSPLQVASTKAVFLLINVFLLIVSSMVFGCATHVYDLTGVWTVDTYIMLNLGGLFLQILIGGFCFWAAALSMERTERFYWSVTGILIVYYVLYLLYYLIPGLDFLKYLTLFSVFRQSEFAAGSMVVLLRCLVFVLAGLALFFFGRQIFCRRNLPFKK